MEVLCNVYANIVAMVRLESPLTLSRLKQQGKEMLDTYNHLKQIDITTGIRLLLVWHYYQF